MMLQTLFWGCILQSLLVSEAQGSSDICGQCADCLLDQASGVRNNCSRDYCDACTGVGAPGARDVVGQRLNDSGFDGCSVNGCAGNLTVEDGVVVAGHDTLAHISELIASVYPSRAPSCMDEFRSMGWIIETHLNRSCNLVEYSASAYTQNNQQIPIPVQTSPLGTLSTSAVAPGIAIEKCSGKLYFTVPSAAQNRLIASSLSRLDIHATPVVSECGLQSMRTSHVRFGLSMTFSEDQNTFTDVGFAEIVEGPRLAGGQRCERLIPDPRSFEKNYTAPTNPGGDGLMHRMAAIDNFTVDQCTWTMNSGSNSYELSENNSSPNCLSVDFIAFRLGVNAESATQTLPRMLSIFDDGSMRYDPQFEDNGNTAIVDTFVWLAHSDESVTSHLLYSFEVTTISAPPRTTVTELFMGWMRNVRNFQNETYGSAEDGDRVFKDGYRMTHPTMEENVIIAQVFVGHTIEIPGFMGPTVNAKYWDNLMCEPFRYLTEYQWVYTLELEEVDNSVKTSVDPLIGTVLLTGENPGDSTFNLTTWDNSVRLNTYTVRVQVENLPAFEKPEDNTTCGEVIVKRKEDIKNTNFLPDQSYTFCGILGDCIGDIQTCSSFNDLFGQTGNEARFSLVVEQIEDYTTVASTSVVTGSHRSDTGTVLRTATQLPDEVTTTRQPRRVRRQSQPGTSTDSLTYFIDPESGAFTITAAKPGNYSLQLTAENTDGQIADVLTVSFIVNENQPQSTADEGVDDATIIITIVAALLLLTVISMMIMKYLEKKKDMVKYDFSSKLEDLNLDGTLDHKPEDRVVPTELPRSSVRLIEEVGQGEFGLVWKGTYRAPRASILTELTVAVKVLRNDPSSQERNELMKEAAVTAQFSHENVVGLIGVVTAGHPAMLVLTYCDKGSLSSILKMGSGSYDVDMLLGFCLDTAKGMKYLANRRFVHRDLAARNVLVNNMQAKIADFGLSRDVLESEYYKSVDANAKLPLRWTAIESIKNKRFSEKSDVWAYAVTMNEIFLDAQLPYREWMNWYVMEMVVDREYKLPQPPKCPDSVYNEVMRPALNTNPDDRPKFEDIVDRLERITKGIRGGTISSISTISMISTPSSGNEAPPVTYVTGNGTNTDGLRVSAMYVPSTESEGSGKATSINPGFYAPTTRNPDQNSPYLQPGVGLTETVASMPEQGHGHEYEYQSVVTARQNTAPAGLMRTPHTPIDTDGLPLKGMTLTGAGSNTDETLPRQLKPTENGYVVADEVAKQKDDKLYSQLVHSEEKYIEGTFPMENASPTSKALVPGTAEEDIVFGFAL